MCIELFFKVMRKVTLPFGGNKFGQRDKAALNNT